MTSNWSACGDPQAARLRDGVSVVSVSRHLSNPSRRRKRLWMLRDAYASETTWPPLAHRERTYVKLCWAQPTPTSAPSAPPPRPTPSVNSATALLTVDTRT